MKSLLKEKILHSGIIFTAITFAVGGGNFVLLGIIRRNLQASGEFGWFGATEFFTALLGLPLTIAIWAVTHHVAHFSGSGDEARLNGLLVGCRRFLLKFTLVLSLLGVLLIQPLTRYFEIPRPSLTLTALAVLLIGLWCGYAMALAQGMGWFKRIALIGLVAAGVKILFAWTLIPRYPVAEAAGLVVAVGTLLNLSVFIWWRDLFKRGDSISPWDRDFFKYLLVAAAGVGAGYCFTTAHSLVAVKFFAEADKDAYVGAFKISNALYIAVAPLLTVLFTARSSQRVSRSVAGPLGLLMLYAAGLCVGALVLFFARDLCVRLLGGVPSPETSAMIDRVAVTMIFAALIQALGMWSMASNWLKATLLYGVLGLIYWGVLLGAATQATPTVPHTVAPGANAGAFIISFQPNSTIDATNYRILHQAGKNSGFTEVTNISSTTHTFQSATNELALPHQFKVVPALPPKTLLNLMPVAAAGCFVVMLVVWLFTLRRSRKTEKS
jgi:hypothetical protein